MTVPVKKLTRAQANALVVKLSWIIIEHKWRYYVGKAHSSRVARECISDENYDKIEIKYQKLCKLIGVDDTACETGFTFQKASRRIVHYKMCEHYGLDPKECMWVG